MAFTDKIDSILIHGAELATGNWVAADEKAQLSADGWDSLTVTYYRLAGSFSVEQTTLQFPIGGRLGGRRWWVNSFSGPHCVGGGIYKVDVTYKGLAMNHPVVVSYGAAAEQQSVDSAIINGVPRGKTSVHENTPTATVRYIIESLSLAPTGQVGTSKVPPSAPAVAPTFWASLASPTYHYPNGWVLMGSNTTPLPGTTVAIVSDDYKYIRELTP